MKMETNFLDDLKSRINAIDTGFAKLEEIGLVASVGDGIARVHGLEKATLGEAVIFSSGTVGMILNLELDHVGVIIFDDGTTVNEKDEVRRTGNILSVPVGKQMLGRVIDALGNPIDDKGPIDCRDSAALEIAAPGIIDRVSIHEPIQTGIKSIDAMIPIGRGQRELIIGNRQTGKSTIALDTILSQASLNNSAIDEKAKLFCIYVAIGQKRSNVVQIVKILEEHGAMSYSVVVCASASEAAALQFIAPYTACAIGEFFRDRSMHSLVIYDDLTKHAIAYRQISLLLRRPPAREAYPGDVFYLHSRLLERAAKLSAAKGGGSLTALPIIETQADDISAYIPTNLISITDGQIFLETELFYKGFRPAINMGLSVSRIGAAAQIKAMKQVSGKIKLELAQFRELESFSQFGSDIDASTKKALDRGRRISDILKQNQHSPLSFEEQIVILFAITGDLLEDMSSINIAEFETNLLDYFRLHHADVLNALRNEKVLSKDLEQKMTEAINVMLKKCFVL